MSARVLLPGCLLGLALLAGCVDPSVWQEKARAFEAGLLESIVDGETTRQDVLLKFGTPIANFEEGRILTYDFATGLSGEWQRVGTIVVSDWMYPLPRATSLVLVFGPDGVLLRHSLVTAAPKPAPPAEAAAPEKQEQVP